LIAILILISGARSGHYDYGNGNHAEDPANARLAEQSITGPRLIALP
jgi:hypothetical protein